MWFIWNMRLQDWISEFRHWHWPLTIFHSLPLINDEDFAVWLEEPPTPIVEGSWRGLAFFLIFFLSLTHLPFWQRKKNKGNQCMFGPEVPCQLTWLFLCIIAILQSDMISWIFPPILYDQKIQNLLYCQKREDKELTSKQFKNHDISYLNLVLFYDLRIPSR